MKLEGELVNELDQPGQFVHLRVGQGFDHLLRRPISICDVDHEKQQLTIIYRAEGAGTVAFSKQAVGEQVDVLGPLGQGFPIEERKAGEHVVLVGGGVGVPPLYYLSKRLKSKGVIVSHVLGFSHAGAVFLADEFAKLGDTYITTIDGSFGEQGLVTDVLDRWNITEWNALYSCGPLPMLRALSQRFEQHEAAYISLEERMGCGIGACFACVCHTPESDTSYKKICTHGPVFRVGEVIL
ncbi:dihydroorotate dehydrogenase electron transfer subunit [Bacillus horti]